MVEKNLKVKQKEPIDLIVRPFQKFAQIEASGGILLVICALIALVWANSPWSQIYHKLWKVHLTFSFGAIHLSYELLHWINDGLMAIFFFVVGMEIKRELAEGELSTREHAMLPVAGAMGGMLLPAAIYLLLNAGDGCSRLGNTDGNGYRFCAWGHHPAEKQGSPQFKHFFDRPCHHR